MIVEFLEARRLFAAAYTIVDLGTLGGDESHAVDINSSNQVVGNATDSEGNTLAFRFSDANGNGVAEVGEMVNLGAFGDDVGSIAAAVNDAGVVVGSSVDEDEISRAVAWTSGNVVDLGLPDGARANNINAGGVIVGGVPAFPGGNPLPFVRTATGTLVEIPLPAGFDEGEAWGVNDAGVVVGYAANATATTGFVYRPDTATTTAIGFPSAAQSESYAWDINRAGQIAGDGYNSSNQYRAFRLAATATEPTNLGVASGYAESVSFAINNAGDVVGTLAPPASAPADIPNRAFLYSGGVMRDLNSNTLIPASCGWVLTEARSINDNGYIVGSGVAPGGEVHGFLLVPRGPTVQAFSVNGGAAQRSRVTSLSVTFAGVTYADAGAFTLTRRSDGAAVTLAASTVNSRTFTFALPGPLFANGSLADGVYDLTVVALKVHADTATGTANATAHVVSFHRLYSDADGDGDSDNADLFQMRSTYGKRSFENAFKPLFDSDNDGDVDNADVFQVRSRRLVEFKGY